MPTKTLEKSIPSFNEWGVRKYGISLFINNHSLRHGFSDGISLDVEDDERGNFVGLGIYDPVTNFCFYWSDWELAKDVSIPKFIAHNGVTDLEKLKKWGFKVDDTHLFWDTQLMAHILDSSVSRGFGLKDLCEKQLGITYPTYEDIVGKHKTKCPRNEIGCCNRVTLDKHPLDLVSEYNAMDCYTTYKLYEYQLKITNPTHEVDKSYGLTSTHYFNEIEKPVSHIFKKMENRGIHLDLPYLTNLEVELSSKKAKIVDTIKNELGDINLNSPKQLLEALHEKQIQPTFKGKPSTDKRALEKFKERYSVIRALLNYSEVDTLLSSFVNPYLGRNTEVVHPHYQQCGTRTGRPSCVKPNLLQIPKRSENAKNVRRMFIPKKGFAFGDCDYGQIEPRILAHLSKDRALCRMFQEGIDFHDFTSENRRIDREKAKVLNLSVGYRATFVSVSQQLKCSEQEAQKEIDQWWSMFPGLHDWEQKLIYESKKVGYFTTLMGRRIKVEGLNEYNKWTREAAERQLINNIAQASAAEVMKKAMISIDNADIEILVQVYDELLFQESISDIDNAMQIAIELMTSCVILDVPLTVDAKIGYNWSDVK